MEGKDLMFLFGIPTQVKFIDDEGKEQMGIAYKNEIICLSNGYAFSAEANIEITRIFHDRWIDLDWEKG